MTQELYSVEQVAERLGLHVRTVRGYVRDGRLKAVRIGKQYRIAREDLEAFTGRPVTAVDRETVRRTRHVEISSIVEVDAIDPEEASRISNGLMAATQGSRDDGPVRVDAIYDETHARLKVIVRGNIARTVGLLSLLAFTLEHPRR
jgi:excisionase family DNA binding protein